MGIHKLMDLLKEKAPGSIRKLDLKFFSGRVVACDASMAMYQFLVQTQGVQDNQYVQLTDKEGNRTGHLVGLFNRTIMMLEHGMKPVWVFDGKPPTLKSGELARRKKMKEEAKEKAEEAMETGNLEEALKQQQRTTTITRQMKEDAIQMLRYLGIPVVIAPCEAEAQCAALTKAKKAYATITEDMDALTFQTEILLRNVKASKEPVTEVNYDQMMKELEMTYDEFVDMCILCGCDYTETIDGVGPITAYKLIKEHKNIENVLKFIQEENSDNKKKKKYGIPDKFYYEDARELFKKPVVEDASKIELKWGKPDEEAIRKFLQEEKGFSESRVTNGLQKIKGKESKGIQQSIEQFFGKPVIVKKSSEKKDVKKAKTTSQKKKK